MFTSVLFSFDLIWLAACFARNGGREREEGYNAFARVWFCFLCLRDGLDISSKVVPHLPRLIFRINIVVLYYVLLYCKNKFFFFVVVIAVAVCLTFAVCFLLLL